MEVAKLILEFLKAFVWPATIVILVCVFRNPLAAILQRITKADLPGGIKLDFQEKIQEAQQLSEKVQEKPTPAPEEKVALIPISEANARMIALGLEPMSSGLNISYFKQIATSDPTLALAALRIEVETLARNIALGFKLELKPHGSAGRLYRELFEKGAITESQLQLAEKILILCNRAIHGETVSWAESKDVIEASSVLFANFLAWLSGGFDDYGTARQLPSTGMTS
jgi:hypothetical protein